MKYRDKRENDKKAQDEIFGDVKQKNQTQEV